MRGTEKNVLKCSGTCAARHKRQPQIQKVLDVGSKKKIPPKVEKQINE